MKKSDIAQLVEEDFHPDVKIWRKTEEDLDLYGSDYKAYMEGWGERFHENLNYKKENLCYLKSRHSEYHEEIIEELVNVEFKENVLIWRYTEEETELFGDHYRSYMRHWNNKFKETDNKKGEILTYVKSNGIKEAINTYLDGDSNKLFFDMATNEVFDYEGEFKYLINKKELDVWEDIYLELAVTTVGWTDFVKRITKEVRETYFNFSENLMEKLEECEEINQKYEIPLNEYLAVNELFHQMYDGKMKRPRNELGNYIERVPDIEDTKEYEVPFTFEDCLKSHFNKPLNGGNIFGFISNRSAVIKVQNRQWSSRSNFRFKDLSPLSNLKYLRELNLDHAEIQDISFLNRLKHLRRIYLYYLKELDLSNIANAAPNLEILSVRASELSGIPSIGKLKKLKDLSLSGFQKRSKIDISSLSELKDVVNIFMSDVDIKDLSPLGELKSLESLSLLDVKTKDFSHIGKLKNLKHLRICDKSIKNLKFTANLSNLRKLEVDHNSLLYIPKPLYFPSKILEMEKKGQLEISYFSFDDWKNSWF